MELNFIPPFYGCLCSDPKFKQKALLLDKYGRPVVTPTDSSNPWCTLLEEAAGKANFLNKVEYLKGISIYESIIKAYASYIEHERTGSSKDEL
ncbi:hypothetical protein PanWU01x14_278820 [Parasponia andersonii]|uniref:Uncharacterized protein n=1 Tax=Parasponia andersonii TaxID=3476 RepID=A0A2P5B1Z4_PARAD|nr:hypothetical protein PanWU01x14_278820 [Parasponia andersonii]